MPAAIALVAVGAQLYGAHKAAGAAKDAARTQVKAGDKALAVQQQVYQDQQARQAPYMQAGLQGLAQAQGYANASVPQFAPGQTAQFQRPEPVPFNPAMQPLGQASAPSQAMMPRTGRGMPMPAGAAQAQGRGMPMMASGAAQGQAQGPAQGGGDVLMQSPDGEQKRVPSSQVPFWTAKGARVIG